jgi:hypothetical protein
MVPDENTFSTRNGFLDKFFDLLVIRVDNALLIIEGFLGRDMTNELETVFVQAGVLLERGTPCIVNNGCVGPHLDIRFRGAIGRVVDVFECRFRVEMNAVVEDRFNVWHGVGGWGKSSYFLEEVKAPF